ncbi:MAG: hypothetical protein RLZZ381_2737 [Cyanobacteriota bacterium]
MKINNVQTIAIESSFWLYLGLIGFVAQPATAESVNQSVNKNQTLENRADRLASFQLKSVSTQAQDLLLPSSSKQSNGVNPTTNRLAQRELDLEKFCQNYPYNSRCSGATPAGEPGVERSPEQIPVPETQSESSQSKSGWAIVPEVSTLGLGGNIVRKITSNFNARVGVNAFGTGINVDDTEFDYEGDLNLFNVSTLIDIQPFKSSGFRLSAGLIFGNNNIQGTADVSEQVADELGEVEFNGETIDIRDLNIDNLATVDADIDINNSVAPYVGIGGGNAVGAGKGLGFWWNLGVVFSGSPEAEVTSNFSDEIPAELRDEVVAAADETLKDEEEDLNDELDVLGVYPVLSLGLSYQF